MPIVQPRTSEDQQPLVIPSTAHLRWVLGWNELPDQELDLDLAVLCLNHQDKLARGTPDFIYAGHPRHDSGAVVLLNDSLTGEGLAGSETERLLLHLASLPLSITRLLLVIHIDCGLENGQDFGLVKTAFWQLIESHSGQLLAQQNLADPAFQGKTTLVVAALNRLEPNWSLTPVNQGMSLPNLHDLLEDYL